MGTLPSATDTGGAYENLLWGPPFLQGLLAVAAVMTIELSTGVDDPGLAAAAAGVGSRLGVPVPMPK